jgi:hypothetical protein
LTADFAPVRWWQVTDFIRLTFETVRGHDPWTDRVLSRPWALSSILEYMYILVKFPISDAYFIVASEERVGVLWMIRRSKLLYLLTLGLLPQFRTSDAGLGIARLLIRTVRFIEDHIKRYHCEMVAARVAALNKTIQRMLKQFDGQRLGLATTTLTLASVSPPKPSLPTIEIRKIGKSEAARAWKHWRLYTVERVAGRSGAKAAAALMKSFYWLDSLPRGNYLALYQDDQEIGFAFARQQEGGLELGLFPSAAFWSGPETGALVMLLASSLGSPVRYLTTTQSHADILADSSHVGFERDREQEQLFIFWLTESYWKTPAETSSETSSKTQSDDTRVDDQVFP